MDLTKDTGRAEKPLRVLHLEDDAQDHELIVHRLQKDGLDSEVKLVRTRVEFEGALSDQAYDLILSDFTLPSYQGMTALTMARKTQPEAPFLFVSGTIGEERAVESLKSGAVDYVLKDNLERLVPSIRRALREVQDRAEKAWAEQQLRLRTSALEAAANGILITDQDGTILSANRAFCLMTGYELAEVLGQNPSLLKSGRHDEAFYRQMWNTIIGGCVWQGEMTNRRKDGTHYQEDQTITPVRSPGGDITHFIAVKQDITHRKQLEMQLLRAQRMESIGTLASGIAHDLNNILAPIAIATQVLRLDPSPEESEQLLNQIESSAKRGADVVRQVLTFARGMDGERSLVQVRHALKEIVKIAQETFPRSISLAYRFAEDLWPVTADSTQLHQVLLNLCVNARDAMPRGGSLELTAENLLIDNPSNLAPDAKAGPYIVLQVKDTGCGIPPEIINKVFEPFFTTKEVGRGTGLGLSTVQRIVKNHRGHLNVYSEVARGTTFRIYIPATPDAETLQRSTEPANLPQGRGELILLVDDEPNILMVTRRLLVKHGYQVLTASDGASALALFAEHQGNVQVVITDMMMPHMQGLGLIRAIRESHPRTKFIAASGLAGIPGTAERTQELKAMQVETFLEKPYSAERLLTALQQLLNR
jgi:two-component system, cell cycle sensor histidine kinase and response regulator CckA